MKWGFFTATHVITLIFAAVLIFGLHFLLKGRSVKTQLWVLTPLSFLGIAAIAYNLLTFDEPLAYLPLHLCSVNAMILPVAVLTRNKTLGNLLLVWCLGALAALVLNNDMAEAELLSWPFFFYYFPHALEFGIPLLLFSLGLVKKEPKCIVTTMGISMGMYTVVHFCNRAVNAYTLMNNITYGGDSPLQVNYMFSLSPNNPLLALFYSVIPHAYWYMYLVLPIIFVYLVIVYAPELVRHFKMKQRTTV